MRQRRWLRDYLASVSEEMDRRRLQARAGIDDHRLESLHRPRLGETREEACAVCLQDFGEKDEELRMMRARTRSISAASSVGLDSCPVCRSAMSSYNDVLEELHSELEQWIQVLSNDSTHVSGDTCKYHVILIRYNAIFYHVSRDTHEVSCETCQVSDDFNHVSRDTHEVSCDTCHVSDDFYHVSHDTREVSDDFYHVSHDTCEVSDDTYQLGIPLGEEHPDTQWRSQDLKMGGAIYET
uniref:RING-type domain-containing protein n=2 Tax=Oryza TaxID=4527 RepID=A0A0E0HKU6_ORYNI